MDENKNLGFDVEISFNEGNKFVLHNITEIHYNFRGSTYVAFESEIHETGYTFQIGKIKEFESKLSIEIAEYC